MIPLPGEPNRNRPSITGLGQVHDDGTQVIVTGWALGLCATSCTCHRDPATGQLAIAADQDTGHLGLATFGPPCDCCQAWTADELGSVIRDVATAARLVDGTTTV